MEKVIEMLEAIVSQGEAQFSCGDEYATFNKNFIERARIVLTNHKPMTIQQAFDLTNSIDACSGLTNIQKMMAKAYMVGQADANLAEPFEAVKENLQKMMGIKLAFVTKQ